MSLTLAQILDDDWSRFDNTESVTIERDGTDLVTGATALFMQEYESQTLALAGLPAKARKILVRKSTLDNEEIRRDDVIVRRDGSLTEERYTIREAYLRSLETRYSCVCTKEV